MPPYATRFGTLVTDFTQFKMSISNELQQLMDNQVHQDNHLIENVKGEFMKQAKQLKKLQEDNQALHK